MIHFAVDQPRRHLLAHYLEGEWGNPLRDRMRQIAYPDLFRARALPRGAWIFTSLESLSEAELRMVNHVQCAARQAGLPVLNPAPEAMRRYELLRALHASGLNEFQAYRAEALPASPRFPVFVRVADEHDGSLTPLLHNPAQLRRAMAYLKLRGFSPRQLLVVEFCETASQDGLYRKYSIFRIGDSYVPRYLHIGPHWMTKQATREPQPELAREELAFLQENPHQEWARQVFELARIDYGRLDYGVRLGRPQAWEINFTPFLAGDPDRIRTPENQRMDQLTRPAKERAHAALREAFARLDPGPSSGTDVPFDLPPALEEQARIERRELTLLAKRRRRIDRLAAAPILSAIGPLSRRALRWPV